MTDPLAENQENVVAIGAGQAGFSVCSKLRDLGFSNPITLIGEEDQPPYQRPPLSKAYLLGKMELERLFLRPRAFYDEMNIDLKLSCRVDAIDRAAKTVRLSDESSLPYGKLVLATGASVLTLPERIGGQLAGVHYVRTLMDADRMADSIRPGKSALVVGGGYIGLEAAAVAAGSGLKVVLVEAGDRILQRVASAETSGYFRHLHRANGVDIREGVMLDHLVAKEGRVAGAVLTDGAKLDVDIVIAGIGIRPNQQLAEKAGLEVDNGIRVDALCRTSDPNIFAIGDCASFPMNGSHIRLESVGNAIDQGELVAAVLTGDDTPHNPRPWFWSDQYDTKLQIAGLSMGYDRIVTRRSDERSVSFWYFNGDRLLAVDAMNDPRAYMVAKRLVEAGKSPDSVRVTDLETDLKTLLR